MKTPDEVKRTQAAYAKRQFLGGRNLTVAFETTPEAVAALLPPPLEPTAEPLGLAWIGDIRNSNCVGPFLAAGLLLRARYRDIVGNFCISAAMSTPEAVTLGRDLYGEPAKLAKIVFEQQDEYVWGSAERHEIRYLSVRGRLTETGPRGRQESSSFHFKYLPRPDGHGFDHPPLLVHVTGQVNVDTARRGRGELIFRDSPHDPVSDIPVRQVIEATYSEGHTYTSGRVLCEVDPDAFLPYSFIKMDAVEVVQEGTLLHAQAARRTRAGKGQWRSAN